MLKKCFESCCIPSEICPKPSVLDDRRRLMSFGHTNMELVLMASYQNVMHFEGSAWC